MTGYFIFCQNKDVNKKHQNKNIKIKTGANVSRETLTPVFHRNLLRKIYYRKPITENLFYEIFFIQSSAGNHVVQSIDTFTCSALFRDAP